MALAGSRNPLSSRNSRVLMHLRSPVTNPTTTYHRHYSQPRLQVRNGVPLSTVAVVTARIASLNRIGIGRNAASDRFATTPTYLTFFTIFPRRESPVTFQDALTRDGAASRFSHPALSAVSLRDTRGRSFAEENDARRLRVRQSESHCQPRRYHRAPKRVDVEAREREREPLGIRPRRILCRRSKCFLARTKGNGH